MLVKWGIRLPYQFLSYNTSLQSENQAKVAYFTKLMILIFWCPEETRITNFTRMPHMLCKNQPDYHCRDLMLRGARPSTPCPSLCMQVTTKNCRKRFFWFSSNYLRFWYWNTYPGYHHVKANVLTVPKMWWFLGLRVFERELSLLKVGTLPKFWVRYQK